MAKLPLRATTEYAKSKQLTMHSATSHCHVDMSQMNRLTAVPELKGAQLRKNSIVH